MKLEQNNLYDFYWDYGRSGELSGLFIATASQVAELIGKEVYFGEVLGKHSEVYGVIEEKDITLVSDDSERIEWLKSVTGGSDTIIGTNPVATWEDQQGWDEEE